MFGVRLGEAVGATGAPAQEQECGALNPSSVMPCLLCSVGEAERALWMGGRGRCLCLVLCSS